MLGDVITACIGTLLTVQRCVAPSPSPPSASVIEAALDQAALALLPRSDSNLAVYNDITNSLKALKAQLMRVC
jgi:DNA-binding helix-hairpin-helix protein with protein kinase domain